MLIGPVEISDPPEDDWNEWAEREFAAAGAALLADERTVGMGFAGRPLTMMEMLAASYAKMYSWELLAESWRRDFDNFLERKMDEHEHRTTESKGHGDADHRTTLGPQ